MSEHSREPWRVVKSPRLVDGDECIASANSTPDAWGGWNNAVLGASESLALSNADARRIVACVNACAGIPTEVLEAMNLGRLADKAKP